MRRERLRRNSKALTAVKTEHRRALEALWDQAVGRKMIDEATWDRGIAGLYRAAEDDGTFCYTFFKATGRP